jgi:preprotein translocase SecE subunit
MLRFLGNLRALWNETLTEVFVKATWPTGKELVHSTLVVVALVALAGAVVVLCDLSLSGLVQFATSLVR